MILILINIKSCRNKLNKKRARLIEDVGLKFDVSENVVEEDSEETTDEEKY